MHTSIYPESLRINNSLNVKFKSINCEQRLKIKYMYGRERCIKTCT